MIVKIQTVSVNVIMKPLRNDKILVQNGHYIDTVLSLVKHGVPSHKKDGLFSW